MAQYCYLPVSHTFTLIEENDEIRQYEMHQNGSIKGPVKIYGEPGPGL